MSWKHNKYAGILTLVLLLQAGLFYTASHGERSPTGPALDLFSPQLGTWHELQNYPIEQEIRDQLKADDLLNRVYGDAESRAQADLFVAYFKTQRTGQSPHSPKNCLPGSGWEPEATGFLDVAVEGQAEPIRINRFVVSHGDEKSVVLYWYQSQRRVIAREFSAKFWLVMDSIRYHRSDTALVRVTVRVANNDPDAATRVGVSFVQTVFPVLKGYLPA
ncbi:MAG TPA: EpsI family protein [Bryobacteraceae bacterium]|jgi:EpsI family protein|nr:EpsI family protein [Bryobacteraceae bacterium]